MRKIATGSIVLTLALFGCTKSETSSTSTTSTQSTSTTATVATAAPPPASTTVAAPAATAGAIASADGERSGARIEVTELKRTSGGTLNLKFTLTNGGSESFGTGSYFGDRQVSADEYRDVSGIHLIDPVNKKKYFVVVDSEKHCVCSKNIPDVKAGEKLNLWAKFPAPPLEVTKVTIEMPHFQPMDDVTISQ